MPNQFLISSFLMLFNLICFLFWQVFIALSCLFFYGFFIMFVILNSFFIGIIFFCFLQDIFSIKPLIIHFYILVCRVNKKYFFLICGLNVWTWIFVILILRSHSHSHYHYHSHSHSHYHYQYHCHYHYHLHYRYHNHNNLFWQIFKIYTDNHLNKFVDTIFYFFEIQA